MKKSLLYSLLGLVLLLAGAAPGHAQRTISVSGGCVVGTVNLTEVLNQTAGGKPYWLGTGTVGTFANVQISIVYENVNFNKWFLQFDGQPYYEYNGNTPLPPNNSTGVWSRLSGTPAENAICPQNSPTLNISGTGTQSLGPAVRYVNINRPNDSGDGLSWNTAHKYLQTALAAAQSGDQIWVAQGTYKPTTSTTDRTISFVMKEGVKIYGGFTSGQTSLGARSTNAALTILSGDINNDNAPTGNSFNVVRNDNNNLTSAAVLDGFTITGGNADGFGSLGIGGGMVNRVASPTVINCVFKNNRATSSGGGISITDGSSTTLINCSFVNNSASVSGGGIFNQGASPTLINCSFQNNTATLGKAITNVVGGNTTVINCVFFGNGGGDTFFSQNSPPLTATYTLFEVSVGGYTDGGNNLTTTVNPFVSTTSTELRQCSPAIDAGSNSANPTATDLAGNPRQVRTIDMGAYEFQGAIPDPYNASLSGSAAICENTSTNLSVNVTGGGSAPYSVVYSDGGANTTVANYQSGAAISVSPMASTTYTLVTVTDNIGCTAAVSGGSATVTVKPIPAAPSLAASPGTTTANQPITVTASGCSGTVNWNASGGTANGSQYTFTAAGSYPVSATCTVDGCTSPASTALNVTISPCPTITLATTSQSNVSCFGLNDGSFTVAASGGTGAYSYSVNGGNSQSSGSFTGLAAGTYNVTATDVNGCTGTTAVTISQPASLAVTSASQTNVACFGGTTGAAAINAPTGGTAPYAYNWTPGDPAGDGSRSVSSLSAGSYQVTVTDANGCQTTQGFTITQPTSALAVQTSGQSNVSCFGLSDGSLSVSASGGTSGYSYSVNGGDSQNSGTFSNLAAGTYNVTATDANGCSAVNATVTITQPAAVPTLTLSANPGTSTNNQPITVTANGCDNGTVNWNAARSSDEWIAAGGTADGNQYTFTAPGSYTISATCTVGGCTSPASASLNVTISPCPTITLNTTSQSNVSCFGRSDGGFTVSASGGAAPYAYSVNGGDSQGGGSFANRAAGTYTVTVTDNNNCTANTTVTITQPTVLAVMPAAQTNVACFGAATGAAAINTPTGGTAPYAYDWTPGDPTGDGTPSVSGLGAGSYQVTVTDGNGCQATQDFTITQPASALAVQTGGQTNVSCFGSSDGSLSVSASGGTSGYTYSLNGGDSQGGGSFTGLAAGTYTVTVTDANGCTASSSQITLSQPDAVPAPTLSASPGTTTANQPITVTANGCDGGTVNWNASGGTASGNQYTFTAPDSYTISATCTVGGCTGPASAPLSLTIEPCPVITASVSGNTSVVFGYGSNCTTLTASGSGGAGPYSFAWSSGATTAAAQLCPEAATTYTVTATDANGCVSEPVQVTVNVQDVRCGNKDQNVTICYYGVTQCVSEKIARRYLSLGATIGGCGSGARIGVEEAAAPLQLSLKAFPNPVQDAVTVEVQAPKSGMATFEVFDLQGRTKQSRRENLLEGRNEVEFRLGALPAGIYLLRVVDAADQSAAVRVSKQ